MPLSVFVFAEELIFEELFEVNQAAWTAPALLISGGRVCLSANLFGSLFLPVPPPEAPLSPCAGLMEEPGLLSAACLREGAPQQSGPPRFGPQRPVFAPGLPDDAPFAAWQCVAWRVAAPLSVSIRFASRLLAAAATALTLPELQQGLAAPPLVFSPGPQQSGPPRPVFSPGPQQSGPQQGALLRPFLAFCYVVAALPFEPAVF